MKPSEDDMEWINIKEQLPNDGECVLAYGIVENHLVPTINIADFHKEVEGNCDGSNQFWESSWGYDIEVTHWTYLPKPPKD